MRGTISHSAYWLWICQEDGLGWLALHEQVSLLPDRPQSTSALRKHCHTTRSQHTDRSRRKYLRMNSNGRRLAPSISDVVFTWRTCAVIPYASAAQAPSTEAMTDLAALSHAPSLRHISITEAMCTFKNLTAASCFTGLLQLGIPSSRLTLYEYNYSTLHESCSS
ncbi:unnamed protein product [Cercospora beticola]|nr:unnamed protein product [Cercospora beticola]